MTTPLIHPEGRVLAALDVSAYAASVADHAGWAAARLGAPLDVVHAIERSSAPGTADLSGNLTLGNREELLSTLAQVDERRGRLAQEQARQLLGDATGRIAQAHPQVATSSLLRHGGLVETLLGCEARTRLFVIGKRGEHADFARGHLGSNLERVMRAVHRPVLVAARAFRPIDQFLIAFDGSATTRRCVEMVAASPLLAGLSCLVLMVGEPTPAAAGAMAWARETLEGAGYAPQLLSRTGAPDAVIAQTAADAGVDLLVMGAYGHSRIRALIVGSTTTQVLRHCPLPVLLLR